MPNNVNTISFGPGQSNVDLQAEQATLLRRQKIADMLRDQSMQQDQTQMVSGRAIPTSKWGSMAKLFQAGASAYMQKQDEGKNEQLGQEAAKRSAAALRALAPAGMFDSAPSAAQAPSDDLMGEPGAAPPQPQQPGPQVDPAMREKWARALTLYQSNPELGGKLIQNLAEVTGNQKDWAAQGVDPRALGTAMLNKEKAGGLVNVAPNNTVLDAGTGKPMYAAPDFANGRSNTFGPNGAPQIAPMQGSEVIPQQAGAIEAAKSAAQASQDMVTVNTPQGPQMMTRAQAVQLSNGGQQQPGQPPAPPQQPPQQSQPPAGAPPNQGFPPGTQMPAPTPGMQSRAEILQQELAAAQADPRRAGDIPAIQRELGGAGRVGSMPGIPLQTPAQAAQQVGQVNNQLAIEKSRVEAAQSPEAIAKLTDAQGVVGLTGMARQLLADGKATGSLGGTLRDKVAGAVGVSTKSSQGAAQLAAIGGALVSKQPKMTGPQSDKDVLLYQQMAGRVGDASVPLGDRLAALDVVEGINRKYLDNNQNSIATEALGANTRNGKIRKYNPVTGRIE